MGKALSGHGKGYGIRLIAEVAELFEEFDLTEEEIQKFMATARVQRRARADAATQEAESKLEILLQQVRDMVNSKEPEVVVEVDRLVGIADEYNWGRVPRSMVVRFALHEWADVRAITLLPVSQIIEVLKESGEDLNPPKGDYAYPYDPPRRFPKGIAEAPKKRTFWERLKAAWLAAVKEFFSVAGTSRA